MYPRVAENDDEALEKRPNIVDIGDVQTDLPGRTTRIGDWVTLEDRKLPSGRYNHFALSFIRLQKQQEFVDDNICLESIQNKQFHTSRVS